MQKGEQVEIVPSVINKIYKKALEDTDFDFNGTPYVPKDKYDIKTRQFVAEQYLKMTNKEICHYCEGYGVVEDEAHNQDMDCELCYGRGIVDKGENMP